MILEKSCSYLRQNLAKEFEQPVIIKHLVYRVFIKHNVFS